MRPPALLAPMLAAAVALGCAQRDEIIATVPAAGDGGSGGAGGAGGVVVRFGEPVQHDLACGEARDLGVADIDGDGEPDLLVGGDCLNLQRGDGAGDFHAAEAVITSNFGSALAAGHIDTTHPDQTTDPIDVVGFEQQARVFAGDGLGGFHHLADVAAGGPGQPGSIGLAQLFADRALELITSSGNELSVWTGDGTGGFIGPHPIGFSSAVQMHTQADMNDDGHVDLLVVAGGVWVVLNQGSGSFAQPRDAGGVGTGSVAVADVDGDQCPDVVAIGGRVGEPAGDTGELRLLRNDCEGTLAAEAVGSLPFAVDVVLRDVDGDQRVDVISSRAGDEPALVVMRGHGDGSFGEPYVRALAADPGRVAVADVDGDGREDVVVALPSLGAVAVLRNETP